MRLASLTWASDVALLVEAAKEAKTELKAFAISDLGDENVEDCIRSLNLAEAILLHPSNQDPLFDRVVAGIDKKIPIVSFGFDPSLWSFSSVPAKIVSTINAYVVFGGLENICNMICYIGKEVLGYDYHYHPPKANLWQGLYHPDAKEAFASVEDYLHWYGKRHDQPCRHPLLSHLLG